VGDFAERVGIQHQIGCRRWCKWDLAGTQVTQQSEPHDADRHPQIAIWQAHQNTTRQGAQQDGQKGAGLHPCIAANQFPRFQMLRHQGVLQRPEDRRLRAHQEQHAKQEGHRLQMEAEHAEQHDRDLGQFDPSDQARLFVFFCPLSGHGRKQEEGQDEQRRGDVGVEGRLFRIDAHDTVGEQHQQRIAEQVVVECAERLGQEEGQEASLAQQVELRCLGRAHGEPSRPR